MIAGIDFSTHAVDIVKLDEETDAATWHRFELTGQDAFDRARSVRAAMPGGSFWDDVLACGIEDPRGYNAGSLYRVQGAILACLPSGLLVQPWIPSAWRAAVGLSGRASKDHVQEYVEEVLRTPMRTTWDWPQDACDAYCIALSTRLRLERKDAA